MKIVPPSGFLPSLYPEAAVTPGSVKRSYGVFPGLYRDLPTSEFAADKGVIALNAVGMGTGICSRPEGTTSSVEGHPELTVKYYTSAKAVDATATATTAFGVAGIFHAPPGEKLKIVATKPQCDATTFDAGGFGLLPIEAGAVSFATATLSDLGGPSCGAGPYAQLTGETRVRGTDFLTAPLAGATVTFSNCPGISATTRADGSWGVQMTKGVPLSLTIQKTGIIPYRLHEIAIEQASDAVLVTRDVAWKPYEPGWSDTGVSLFAGFDASGAGACATNDGVTVTVKDHPEAVVHYLDTAVPPVEVAGGTATTLRGYAEITGLPAGRYEFVVTTGKACKVGTVFPGRTGVLDAVAGYENIIYGKIENP